MSYSRAFLFILLIGSYGCGGIGDDLAPSGTDKRDQAPVSGEAIPANGGQVGDRAPDLSFTRIDGTTTRVNTLLATHDALVLYFSMWCPICDSHMAHMLRNTAPDYPNVAFVVVDFVSGAYEIAAAAAQTAGYAGTAYVIVADESGELTQVFLGGMGVTVLINKEGVVVMNEDYRTGARLREGLDSL